MVEIKTKEGDTIAYAHDKNTASFLIPDQPVIKESWAEDSYKVPFEAKPGRFKDMHTPPHFRYPSTTKELMEYATQFFSDCKDIAYERNQRYAGAYDPFKNFRLGEDYGIAIRMSDKVSRLLTLLHPSNTIDSGNESIEDTCRDLANYAMLLSAMRANERGAGG